MLVSFIIPSYNSAHTVKRCLDSIYALSLKPFEFEVIFVDDCSTDNTIEIVSRYALNDELSATKSLNDQSKASNLILLRQTKNNRQGAARNRGVSIAKGEYICFVDSDDAVTEGVVDAIRTAKEQETDMTAFHTASANENGQITKENERLSFSKGQVFAGVELQNKYPYWFSGPVAYIYSKAFLDSVNYPFREGVLYEDSDFVMVHLYYAQRMAYSPNLGYLAYYREGSTTHSVSYKNQSDYLLLGTRMLALYTTIQNEMESHKRNDDELTKFAEGVLEGATYNVTMALKRLNKLNSSKEIIAFYDRVDANVNRLELSGDKRLYQFPVYWSIITKIGLKHKYLSIALNTCLLILHGIYIKLKDR